MRTKALLLSVVLLAAVPGLWAAVPDAVLQSLKGKVEVKIPGATWVRATEGQVLSPASTLSTGFDSSVVVVIGKTTLQVKPLTRMTIDKLVEEGGAVKTSTFLRVGSVAASVKSADGVKQDFKVQSPYSTASVRGTDFVYDGFRLKVNEGLVALILGRLERESQPSQGPVAGPIDHKEDFVGSPDVTGDPNKAVPVPAGSDASVVIDFKDGGSKTSSSNDLDSLQKNSGQNQGNIQAPNTQLRTKGGVVVTIQFQS